MSSSSSYSFQYQRREVLGSVTLNLSPHKIMLENSRHITRRLSALDTGKNSNIYYASCMRDRGIGVGLSFCRSTEEDEIGLAVV